MAERVRAVLVTVGAVAIVVGSFAPWLAVGPTTWSSFDLRNLVVELGFSVNGLVDWAVRFWVVVPALLVVAVLAGWWHRTFTSAVFGSLGGLYSGVVAFVVTRAPDIALYDVEWGVPTSFVGAALVLVASAWGFVLTATRYD